MKFLMLVLVAEAIGKALGEEGAASQGIGVCPKATAAGSLSPGYFTLGGADEETHRKGLATAPTGSLTCDPFAKLDIGEMSWVDLAGSLTLKSRSEFLVGRFTQVELGTECDWLMNEMSFVKQSSLSAGADRAQVICNSTVSMNTDSLLSIAPQVFLNISKSFTMGSQVFITLQKSAVLEIGSEVNMNDLVHTILGERSRLVVNSTTGGIVTFTSGNTAGSGTLVELQESSRILVEGIASVGGSKGTKLIFSPSAYLHVGPHGEFDIAAATMIVGESSYWIIEGQMQISDKVVLKSGLQSQLTIPQGAQLTNDQINLGDRSNVIIGKTSFVQAVFTVMDGSFVSFQGAFEQNIASADLSVGNESRLVTSSGVKLTLFASLTLQDHAVLEIESKGSPSFHSCILTRDYEIDSYDHVVINTLNDLPHGTGLSCF